MSRPNPFVLIVILAISALYMAGMGLWPGVLMISVHEGDTYHMLDILYRLEAGQVPHTDYMTPLGRLTFLPVEILMARGLTPGQAMMWSQVTVAAVLAPVVWYVAWSRLPKWTGYGFAAFIMVLVLALSFGGEGPGLSMSMHYNRWGWAVGSVLLVLVFAPSEGQSRPVLDGAILGAGLSALVFLKATFFVALVPAIAFILVAEARRTEILVAVVTGAAAALAATVAWGFGFWADYVGDLVTVARSDVRPNPSGMTFVELLSEVKNIATIVVAAVAYWLFAQSGHRARALGLLLFVAGGFYITYQNFGHDPKWLVPLAAVLMAAAWLPGAEAHRTGFRMAALAATMIFLPSALTLTMSVARHAAQEAAIYDPMLPGPRDAGVMIRRDRGNTMTAEVALDGPGQPWEKYAERVGRPDPDQLGGVEFEHCNLLAGTAPYFTEIGEDLLASGVPAGSQLFVTDILTAFWLFHDFQPLQGGAPWYYGGLSGIENADYVVVPKCTFVARIRGIMLRELEAADLGLQLVSDGEIYALFRVP